MLMFDSCGRTQVSVFRAAAPFDIRIVYAPLGELDDYDDVRVYERAAGKAIARAIKAGAQHPVLVLPTLDANNAGRFRFGALSTLLGALHQLYVVSNGYWGIFCVL